MHCGFQLGGKCFPNAKARIHLSGNSSLRNGSVSQLCTKAPEEVNRQFTLLEQTKRSAKHQKDVQRKRATELMCATPSPVIKRNRRIQGTLPFHRQIAKDDDVDLAWGKAFFGLDIAPAKISHPLFREAICTSQQSRTS